LIVRVSEEEVAPFLVSTGLFSIVVSRNNIILEGRASVIIVFNVAVGDLELGAFILETIVDPELLILVAPDGNVLSRLI
jgi:hypothetical protein